MRFATLIQPAQFELRPVNATPPDTSSSRLFALRFLFQNSENWQTRFPTFVSASVVPEFQAKRVVEVHLEALPQNGAAQQSLPGSPDYVVLSVLLADGTRRDCVPPELKRARNQYLWRAAYMAIAGSAALTFMPSLGGLLIGLATHPLRTALGIPIKPSHSVRVRLPPPAL